ncbi:hypothetical protein [Butyrivibrio sp. AE2032]|uniref:hypothetical protein n=1 Tax=Butyrivibrio sp. AE2032 TaxID=1458463 RepID=UPI00055605D8|nr:hypothetical protein [Butyrivibrio sp. AE2032]
MEDKKYSVGQHVFIISNNSYVMEMEIMRITGDFYTLRYVQNYGSGIRLKKYRLYSTKEEAEAVMDSERKKRDSGIGRPRHWYD